MRRHLLVILATLILIPSVAQELPMDYSYCGYHCSEQPIPSVKAATYVTPSGQDDAATIQAAIDWVSQQKPDKQTGFRGAVLLSEGTFTISVPLRIHTCGVVLRGSGRGKTILRKTGYDRGAAIYIEGTRDVVTKGTLDVADVKPGALQFSILNSQFSITKGQRLAVCRPSTQE